MPRQRQTITTVACGLAVVCLVLTTVAFAGARRTYTETRHTGSIEAVFSYRSKNPFGYEGQRLLVRRADRTALEVQLPADSSWPSRPGHSLIERCRARAAHRQRRMPGPA